MKIYFATANPHKLEEMQHVLEEYRIRVEQIDVKGEEVQSYSVLSIVEHSAKRIAMKFSKPFIVEDAALQVECLNTFPGPYSSYVFKTIGPNGILRLMEGNDDRYAEFHSAIAYGEKGKLLKTIVGIAEGTISEEIKGGQGFGFDPIFVPNGGNKTFGEMTLGEKNRFSHRAKAARVLGEWLSSK